MAQRIPEFRGFVDDDKTRLQNKLALINNAVARLGGGQRARFRNPSAESSTSNSSTSSSNTAQRPINRFLKRSASESLPSSSKTLNSNLINNAIGEARKNKAVPSSSLQLITPIVPPTNGAVVPVPGSSSNSNKLNGNGGVNTRPVRVNKFLKIKTPTSGSSKHSSGVCKSPLVTQNDKKRHEDEPSSQTQSPTKVAAVFNKISSHILEKPQPPPKLKRVETEEPKKDNTKKSIRAPVIKTKPPPIHPKVEVQDVEVPVVPAKTEPPGEPDLSFEENVKVEIVAKVAPKSEFKDESEAVLAAPVEKISSKPNNPSSSHKQPTPAKRTSSLPELQTSSSRSKRTPVPNKRYLSEDSEPPITPIKVPKPEMTSPVPKAKTTPAKIASTQRNSVPALSSTTPSKKSPPTSAKLKKRSVSGDVVQKRKMSTEANLKNTLTPLKSIIPISGASTGTELASTSQSSIADPNARSRRPKIPNRKYMDEDEVVKELTSKKTNDSVEHPPRKRRKSEKDRAQAHNHHKQGEMQLQGKQAPDIAAVVVCDQPKVELNGTEKKQLTNSNSTKPVFATKTVAVPSAPPPPPPSVQVKPSLPSPTPILLNGNAKPEDENVKKDEEEVVKKTPSDELPLTDDERSLFGDTQKFLGACILKIPDLKGTIKNNSPVSAGILCCGVCKRLKKYRYFNQKRMHDSYICAECANIVNNIFEAAEKSRPLSCIRGPPVCEGSCPLIFTPPDQSCEACFAKACLTNIPMKHDIYFKIWRSIPPMSRGRLPYSPVANPATPNVGKVIIANQGTIKVATLEDSGPNPTKPEDSSNSIKHQAEVLSSNDLNSARLTTFNHHRGASTANNCENTVPDAVSSKASESLSSSELIRNNTHSVKTNGVTVAQEEILLGRQIGQERVKTLVDPILRPDLDDIEMNGFPVIVSGPAYPRKPLCFLCGSAGIEQLIFCSMCCEPYHPYCAGDEQLLNNYMSRYDVSHPEYGTKSIKPSDNVLKVVAKWKCRRCMCCTSCNEVIGQHPRSDFIRCIKCFNPYHLKTCIEKSIVNKFKSDVIGLQKVWTCSDCMNCESCGQKIEFISRLKAIQNANGNDEDNDDEENDNDESEEGKEKGPDDFVLCRQCTVQRKKGSYCPLCDKCYSDDDWITKMVECAKCNRWVHASCENISDVFYNILGVFDIEFICRKCHASSDVPVWLSEAQSVFVKLCMKALTSFEEEVIGVPVKVPPPRKRELAGHEKPSYVCKLNFDDLATPSDSDPLSDATQNEGLELESENKWSVKKKIKKEMEDEETRRICLRSHKKKEKSVTSEEIMTCVVKLRDFMKYPPKRLEENWYTLRYLEVEMLTEGNNVTEREPEVRVAMTPIHSTPKRMDIENPFTSPPRESVDIILSNIKNSTFLLQTMEALQKVWFKEIFKICETEAERKSLAKRAFKCIEKTFADLHKASPMKIIDYDFGMRNDDDDEDEILTVVSELEAEATTKANNIFNCNAEYAFKEVYWNPHDFFDYRCCALCGEFGDSPPSRCGRLLWCGINEWVHCNCAIWSSEVFEMDNGALENVGNALNRGKITKCKVCTKKGATVSCCLTSCKNIYHLTCAIHANCYMLEDKRVYCSHHPLKEKLECIDEITKYGRKVYVDLKWLQKRGLRTCSDDIKIFIGSLKINCLGNVIPISASQKDEDTTILIPKNFVAERLFWSLDNPHKKESYVFQTSVMYPENANPMMMTHDPGVNFVVNHGRTLNGLDNISKFHQWIQSSSKFIDEDFTDWLTPCQEEFFEDNSNEDKEDFEVDVSSISTSDLGGRSSPSSISSFGSFRKRILPKKSSSSPEENRTYHFRRLPGRTMMTTRTMQNHEDYSTDDYTSTSSYSCEEPKSLRSMKRRRSSLKTSRKSKSRFSPKKTKTFESPRRRSMRNHKLESQNLQNKTKHEFVEESDNDSGVIIDTASSATESCDDWERQSRQRINLLPRFDVSFDKVEELKNRNHFIDDIIQVDGDGACGSESHLMPSSNFKSDGETDESATDFNCVPVSTENEKVFQAVIKMQIKRQQREVCYTYPPMDLESCWTLLFNDLSRKRQEYGIMPLSQPGNVTSSEEYAYRMFGLSHRSVQFLIEQLPDVIKVADQHKFRYRSQPNFDRSNFDYPLPRNSTGSARSEGFAGRKPVDMFGWLASRHRVVKLPASYISEEIPKKNFGLPIAMRFRDLGKKAKSRFVVSHSEIHGRGLFACCDMEKGDMLIEYAGEVIRPSLSDPREKYYESKGIGCYMFRVKTQVIDATMKGNAARFINHSCDPNCEAKTERILGKDHIIIYALRNIFKGEELTYDYKFEREENKIPCSCGAPRCRRYMN